MSPQKLISASRKRLIITHSQAEPEPGNDYREALLPVLLYL